MTRQVPRRDAIAAQPERLGNLPDVVPERRQHAQGHRSREVNAKRQVQAVQRVQHGLESAGQRERQKHMRHDQNPQEGNQQRGRLEGIQQARRQKPHHVETAERQQGHRDHQRVDGQQHACTPQGQGVAERSQSQNRLPGETGNRNGHDRCQHADRHLGAHVRRMDPALRRRPARNEQCPHDAAP